MKYFILEEERKNPLPEIGCWFGTLTPKSNTEKFSLLADWVILDAKIRDVTLYGDILSYPCILLSEKMLKVFEMYCGALPSKRIVLLNKENQIYFVYYLPKLPAYSVLRKESELDKMKNQVVKGILEKEKMKGIKVFLLEGVMKPTLVIGEDVAESLIRREVKGIRMQELEMM